MGNRLSLQRIESKGYILLSGQNYKNLGGSRGCDNHKWHKEIAGFDEGSFSNSSVLALNRKQKLSHLLVIFRRFIIRYRSLNRNHTAG
jgi:hypothetical protein